MTFVRYLCIAAACAAAGGCVADGPAADGASVRAAMASQVMPPRPHAAGAVDGGAAVAAYANYRQSYVAPQPQGDSPLVGARK